MSVNSQYTHKHDHTRRHVHGNIYSFTYTYTHVHVHMDCIIRLFHNATVSQCDHFLLLHMYMYLLFETSPGWLPGWRGFFNSIWWGALSSNVFTICAVYWSLGRRGYFGVSNVVLVWNRRLNEHYQNTKSVPFYGHTFSVSSYSDFNGRSFKLKLEYLRPVRLHLTKWLSDTQLHGSFWLWA